MNIAVTSEMMKEYDRSTIEDIGIPSLVLMERAALKVSDFITDKYETSYRILVVCGTGNNAADGLAVARILNDRGYHADIYLCKPDAKGSLEYGVQLGIVERYGITIYKHDNDFNALGKYLHDKYDVVVDAMFGTGLSRDVSGAFYDVIDCINAYGKYCDVISIDIASGLNSDTGLPMGIAVRADYTLSLAYIKTGLILSPAYEYVGEIILCDIGITDRSHINFKPKFFCNFKNYNFVLPVKPRNAHKGDCGRVLIIAGNQDMSGACTLAAKAAYRTGAGLVYVATHKDNISLIHSQIDEAIVFAYNDGDDISNKLIEFGEICDCVLIGPGLGQSELSDRIIDYALRKISGIKVIDADAINYIARQENDYFDKINGEIILTPHLKEFSRIVDIDVCEIKKNMLFYPCMFTQKKDCICVMKDASTLVTYKDKAFINTYGNSGMAKGGSGDVLSGMLSSALAQHYTGGYEINESFYDDLWEITCGIVELHAIAGDCAKDEIGEYSMNASDIIENISKAISIQRGE